MHLQVLSKHFMVYAVSTLFSSLTESGRKNKPESSCCFQRSGEGWGRGDMEGSLPFLREKPYGEGDHLNLLCKLGDV